MKTRGLVSVSAGIFIVALISGIWLYISYLVATGAVQMPAADAAAFFGQLHVAFAMIILCGFLGIGGGIWLRRRGTPNRFLTVATIILFVAALGVMWQATKLVTAS